MKLYDTRGASRHLETAHYIIRTEKTLQKYRVVGGGPKFRRIGTREIAYAEEDLVAWAQSMLSAPMASTSEAA